MSTSVIWFRKDLRVHDNPTLLGAVENADEVVPVYVLDEKWFSEGMHGGSRIDGFRASFLAESLENLRDKLQELGGDLIVRKGDSASVLEKIVEEFEAESLHFQTLPGTEELEVEESVKTSVNCDINRYWTHTLYHLNDLPTDYRNIDDTFTPWRKETQYNAEVRDTVDEPDSVSVPNDVESGAIPDSDIYGIEFRSPVDKSSISYEGGEDKALERVEEYIWEEDKLKEYKETRNGLLGENYSSKFSPWLANGCLSPRLVYEEVQDYEDERVSNDSTYWLIFELMWRDFFQFQFIKHGRKFFYSTGIRDVSVEWSQDMEVFRKWCEGETGIPFVDANMREINQTGYMSNRGRQNVASFLVDVLDVDWRLGASYFEQKLVDYDVCSNWGNWAYIAGVGNDSRDDRYFNVLKQGDKYDKNAEYIRHWIPELDNLPADAAHQPWNMNEGQQAMYGVELGEDYPEPIVDVQNKSYRELVNTNFEL